ncbi:hypothetical protein [Methylobacterium sp. SD21]|uniref:hypothetical protein n=1 Tax=Methylobacterium litchii TaxID=3138810 RepID=UPI00313EEA36
MLFTITATTPVGVRTDTRKTAASAIVLAMNWEEKGFENILITPPDQPTKNFKVFQSEYYGMAGSARKRHRRSRVYSLALSRLPPS